METINLRNKALNLNNEITDFISFDNACRFLGVSKKALNQLVNDKLIPAVKGEHDYSFSKSVLAAYKDEKEFKNTTSTGKLWEIQGDFSTEGLKKMAKRTFQELASNIEELIVNAYDADAKLVQIILNLDKNALTIIDDGNGMNEKALSSYVIYGESEKSSDYRSPLFQRSPIGEYGIGGKLAITNISRKCKIITRKDGQEHAFSMDKKQLDNAKYLSDVKREVYSINCPKNLHGSSIFMEDLLYKNIDVNRLVERFSTKMPKSQNFKITLTIIENGKEQNLEIKEPTFPFEEHFHFESKLKLIGNVKLDIFYTKEPVPATKQGIWTKVNGRIVNEKQEWFGLLNLTSGQRYRWRLYGYGEANGLKDFVTFSKNDFVDSPEYKEYYVFVHKSLETVQKTLLKRDEDVKKEEERELIKEVEKDINEVVSKLDQLEIPEEDGAKVKKVFTPRLEDAPNNPFPDIESEKQFNSVIKRGKDKRERRNQSLENSDKINFAGENYKINTVDLSTKGDLVSFSKENNLIEINEKHPLYSSASKENYLEALIRDIAFTQIANDYSEGNTSIFNRVFNELVRLYVNASQKTEVLV